MLLLLLACPDPGAIPLGGRDSATAPTAPTDSGPTSITGGQDSGTDDSSTRPDDTGVDPEDEAIYQAFYDPTVMHEVRITLSTEAIRELEAYGRDYVEGEATLDGTAFSGVGVRLKGSSTYQDFSGKPSFKLKLDEFEGGQKYGTLQRITLNNMIGDPSQSRELIDYWIWNQSGLFAPRASYARVYVNDELFGLYTNLESVDDEWVQRRYARADGDLWASALDSADFGATGLALDSEGRFRYWDLESGVGDTSRLLAVKDGLDRGTGDFFADLGDSVDTEQFLAYWALNTVIGNDDGYPWHLNDVFLYVDPADGRIDFSPWGMDEAWNEALVWNGVIGRVALHCLGDQACIDALKVELEAKLGLYDDLDITSYAAAGWALSEDAVLGDPRCPYTPSEVSDARDALSTLILTRSAGVRAQVGL